MDTVLWTTVAGASLLFVVQYLAILAERNDVQEEARIVSKLADEAASEALPILTGAITSARNAGGAEVITITALEDYETLPTLPRQRDLHLVHYAPDATTLWVLAYTTGAHAGSPRSAPGIVNLGIIDHDSPCSNTEICGPGLRWTYTSLTTLLPSPPADGSMVALRLLDADPASDPFVWRIDSGDTTRTTMTTDLDLAGNNIVNANDVAARMIVPETTMQVEGSTEVDELAGSSAATPVTVAGNLAINGTLTGTTMVSDSYGVGGNDVRVVNAIDANRITTTGKVIVKGNMLVTSNLTTPKLTGDITTDAMSMLTLEANTTTVQGDVIVNRASTGDLDLDPGQLTVRGILYVTQCTGTGCTVGP